MLFIKKFSGGGGPPYAVDLNIRGCVILIYVIENWISMNSVYKKKGGELCAVTTTKDWFIHLTLSYTKIVTLLIIL